MKDLIDIRADQVKAMIGLAIDRGLAPPILSEDVDGVITDPTLSSAQKMHAILSYHKLIHELVYAPPGRS